MKGGARTRGTRKSLSVATFLDGKTVRKPEPAPDKRPALGPTHDNKAK